jgi:epoxyqueuosine reductase
MHRSQAALTEKIKRFALESGFAAAGVARVSLAPRETESFRKWIDKGFHGEMAWLARSPEKRLDPGSMPGGARSIVSVLLPYAPVLQSPFPSEWGEFARYAKMRDYHLEVKERLAVLLGRIRGEVPGAKGFPAVDTSAVLEKAFAVQAGIGFRGKNSLVIHPQLGSSFFLGEIVLDIDLLPDSPIPDRCGSCTACLEACPTGALVGPFVLDARKCISYLTTEKAGILPPEEGTMLGGSVFGCDRCQEACPWNQKPLQAITENAPSVPADSLDRFLPLSEEEFKRRFRESPIKDSGREILLRNLCIAAGNLKHSQAAAICRLLARDPDPTVNVHAARALEQMSVL